MRFCAALKPADLSGVVSQSPPTGSPIPVAALEPHVLMTARARACVAIYILHTIAAQGNLNLPAPLQQCTVVLSRSVAKIQTTSTLAVTKRRGVCVCHGRCDVSICVAEDVMQNSLYQHILRICLCL